MYDSLEDSLVILPTKLDIRYLTDNVDISQVGGMLDTEETAQVALSHCNLEGPSSKTTSDCESVAFGIDTTQKCNRLRCPRAMSVTF